jgi:cell division protein FtsQ
MPDDTGIVADETRAREDGPLPVAPIGADPVEVVIPEAEPTDAVPRMVPASIETRAPHVVSPARRRALMPWAIVAGFLVVLGAVAIGLTYTPMFHAKTIMVTGERRLSEARILKIAGVGPGTDVFHADLRAAERRLERNPWIASATVSRRLPSSISVQITERRPVALARSSDGTLTYLALDGSVLAPAGRHTLLPEVQVEAGADEPAAMAAGASVAEALPPGLLPEVASISVDAEGSVIVGMRSGVTAAYGDGSDARAKGQALKAVIDYAATNGRVLLSVNIEVPGAPTAVFADGSSAVTTPPSSTVTPSHNPVDAHT